MADNNRACLRGRVQERRNGRQDLSAGQRVPEEVSRVSKRYLQPAVLGKFDSCKKGAAQSPRAKVTFAMGYRTLAVSASNYFRSISGRMSTKDSQHLIIA